MEAIPQPRSFQTDRQREAAKERTSLINMDFTLLGVTFLIVGFSIYTLAVTTAGDIPGEPYYYALRQAIYAVVGTAFMFAAMRVDYSRFRELRVGIYAAILGLIALVIVFGTAARGQKASIEFPFFSFQPSEIGKVLLLLALSAFVLDGVRRVSPARKTLQILLLGMIPAAMVLLQPDLGTASVYVVITFAVLWIGGTRWTHLAVLGGAATAFIAVVLVVMPALNMPLLEGYQEDRLTAFLDPSDDPGDSSYQINQSLIAIGSGGKTGRGDESTQSQNGFLPERHTDFIFAVVAERFGFVGAAILMSLYALLIWRALRILTMSKNLYGSMIAGGIAAMLLFHLFVNVGMNLGIAPITGIPLPLMSFGGSSVVAMFLAVGILQSIHIQARLTSKSRAPAY
ncbi:rod shape-determining protein RodA [Thermoleophilia bacterium SCSIO 60948]|nr:rod shape-determining protein RodA [Thermoleophilia bacterium SCSIO 60948]